jgi:KaiC/GvpD/RAD55 family RecA-like ATPase
MVYHYLKVLDLRIWLVMVYFVNATDKNILIDTFTCVQSRGFSLVSLTKLQEIPSENMILLAGPPGSGKSKFCQQVTLAANVSSDR